MKRILLCLLIFLCVSSLSGLLLNARAAGPDAGAAAEVLKIQKAYEGLKDLSGSFTQTNFMIDLEKTAVFEGVFYIKMPSKMRWTYEDQEIILKGDRLIIYRKSDNQAYLSKFDKQTQGVTPVLLLSGFAHLEEEFHAVRTKAGLQLKPKDPMGGIRTIEITLSKGVFPIQAFKLTDSYANTVEITLKEVKLNTNVTDTVFDFTIPKGANIYDQTK